MQRILNYLNVGFLLLVFCTPIPIIFGIVPNYLSLHGGRGPLWALVAVFYVIATGVFIVAARMNRRTPPPGFAPPSARKMVWACGLFMVLYAVFIPVLVFEALPAFGSYIWNAQQTVTVTVADAALSATGRYSCTGAVRVEGLAFFSRICGVPEDLRSQMKPGDKIEVSGPGHAFGIRVETVRLLP